MAFSYWSGVLHVPSDTVNNLTPNGRQLLVQRQPTIHTPSNWIFSEEDPDSFWVIRYCDLFIQNLDRQLHIQQIGNNTLHYFAQLEKGPLSKAWHLHLCLSASVGDPRHTSKLIQKVEHQTCNECFGRTQNTWQPNKNSNGSWKTVDNEFIIHYFLTKLPYKECTYAWTNLQGKIGEACNNIEKRKIILKSFENDSGQPPVFKASTGDKLKSLVDYCIKYSLFSPNDFRKNCRDVYMTYACTQPGNHMLTTACAIAKEEAMERKPLGLQLANFASELDAENWCNKADSVEIGGNKIYDIMILNGYDPIMVAYAFYNWAMQKTGKRNTIWLYGPATTGKTILARGIATGAISYGCVNWNNQNFPFQDISGAAVGWWEEGKVTEASVEQTKALLGGGKIRIDIKCKPSVEINSPPFIMTSNVDMTQVYSGNTISWEHRKPLQDRMIKITLDKKLPPDYGVITPKMVIDFFRYGAFIEHHSILDQLSHCTWKSPKDIPHIIPKVNFVRSNSTVEKPLTREFAEEERAAMEDLDSYFPPAPKKKKGKTKLNN
uniref:Putative non-structural protein n=1 Tax=Bovine copiparvovirus 3 TaxID=2731271 RepID=A0A6M3YRQ6_9VIRU|nr:putative non-structural protein [Bovine copiparvovirus 3]